MEEYERLLEGCTNAKQRLIIALARIGGIRCPSELCGLRWSEIHWKDKWFWVHSSKTEHYEGKGKRKVPLFPKLERRFQELYDTLPEGCDDFIFPEESDVPPIISPKKSLSSWIQKVANRAGVELWQKPFQNCRSSRDTELRKTFPEYLVNRWIGHTQQVAEAHYAQTLLSDFIDAYNTEKNSVKMGVERAEIGCIGIENEKILTPDSAPFCPSISVVCNEIHYDSSVQKKSPSNPARTRTLNEGTKIPCVADYTTGLSQILVRFPFSSRATEREFHVAMSFFLHWGQGGKPGVLNFSNSGLFQRFFRVRSFVRFRFPRNLNVPPPVR